MRKGRNRIRLRKAEEKDQIFLGKVCLSVHKLYEPFMGKFFITQAHRYEDALPSGYHIYIVEEKNKSIGFVGYKRKEADVMYIPAFYLLESYWGKGYGQRIMQLLEEQFKEKQIGKIILEVHYKAKWARKFYYKQGFVRALGMDDYKNDKGDEESILLCKEMVKEQCAVQVLCATC